MKKQIFILAVFLILGAGVALVPAGCSKSKSGPPAENIGKYHCPMHPSVVSDKPGDCPICGMKLVPIDSEKQTAPAPAKTKTLYRSTMNPSEVSDQPGKDSMGMDMESFEVAEGGESSVPGLAAVSITPEDRQRMGLTLGTVQKKAMARNIRTSARIVADETRLFRVTTKVDGWVDQLMVSVTGQAVHKGDPLLTIYSPQLVSAQQEYLNAVQAADTLAAGATGEAAEDAKSLMDSARERLQLWDVGDEQIARLGKTHQVEKTMTLYAQANGFVTEKEVLAGQKIMPGESLMVVADLSVVWGDADIYESDLPYVQVGMPMNLTFPYWPGKTFGGKVSFLSPSLDPETRTLTLRLEIPNPDSLLKLGMFADASLHYPLGEKLVAPESAILRTGEHTYAFRDSGDGKLVPVAVQVGMHSDGDYEILSGLNEGDRLVTSATFLVDSESSMRSALEALSGK